MTRWPVKPLVDAANLLTTRVGAFSGIKYYVSTGDVDGTRIASSLPFTYDSRPSRADLSVVEGDVLFARMQATRKVVAVTNETKERLWSTGFAALRPKTETDSRWLFYWLRSKPFNDQKDALCTGATQKAITNDGIRHLTIPLPPLVHQKRIVRILDETEALLGLRNQTDRRSEEITPALFEEFFGDPIQNKKQFPVATLSENVRLVAGYAFRSEDFCNEGIPVIRIGNANKGDFDLSDLAFLPESFASSHQRFLVYPDDVVITLTGTVGKDDYGNVCFVSAKHDRWLLNQRVAKFEFTTGKLIKEYLFHAFRRASLKAQLIRSNRGVRQANLSNQDVLNLMLPIPDIKQQREFALHLSQIRAFEATQANSRTRLNNLFQSAIQSAFQGEL